MTETVAIIDYGSGNLRSVQKAFERAASDSGAAARAALTNDPRDVETADRVVLPGVGAFAACRAGLFSIAGMVDALSNAVLEKQRPFMGICVGMQLLASRGFEFGETPGLSWIAGDVRPLAPQSGDHRVPHMGWNGVFASDRHPVFDAISDDEDFYFLHSFCFAPEIMSEQKLFCEYGGRFAAAVARDNLVGVQFHPEKSQAAGLRLISRFLRWSP